VTISVAPHERYARVARTVVASCASLEGFDVDDLGDVRLLVDTAFHALTEIGRGPVEINVWSSDGVVAIAMSASRRPGCHWTDPGLEPLEAIASVVAIDRAFDESDGRLVMRTTLRTHGLG
jgi:hypothetical protein